MSAGTYDRLLIEAILRLIARGVLVPSEDFEIHPERLEDPE